MGLRVFWFYGNGQRKERPEQRPQSRRQETIPVEETPETEQERTRQDEVRPSVARRLPPTVKEGSLEDGHYDSDC